MNRHAFEFQIHQTRYGQSREARRFLRVLKTDPRMIGVKQRDLIVQMMGDGGIKAGIPSIKFGVKFRSCILRFGLIRRCLFGHGIASRKKPGHHTPAFVCFMLQQACL